MCPTLQSLLFKLRIQRKRGRYITGRAPGAVLGDQVTVEGSIETAGEPMLHRFLHLAVRSSVSTHLMDVDGHSQGVVEEGSTAV